MVDIQRGGGSIGFGWLAAFALSMSNVVVGCAAEPQQGTCRVPADCPAGRTCVAGVCRTVADASIDRDRDAVGPTDADPTDAGVEAGCALPLCGSVCCPTAQRCVADTCVRDLGPCTGDDECQSDAYCLDGHCVPYGVPPAHTTNPMCMRRITIDSLAPAVQCRWSGPPAGDAFPLYFQVMSTPAVVDFDLDGNPMTLAPSIVFATFPTAGSYGNPGILRVIDGGTCAQQWSFDAMDERVVATASPAVADLDGDGRAEIVAVASGGGLISFRYDGMTRRWSRSWHSGTCTAMGTRTPDAYGPGAWGGPSIHDLDDDGRPEIILGGVVYGADGCIRDAALGFPAGDTRGAFGVLPVIADIDEDGQPELVMGNGIYAWDRAMSRWMAEPYFRAGTLAQGHVAVADMGMFPLAAMGGEDRPEIVVVSSGTVRVQTIEGTVVFGPTAIPGGGAGGPPTIADFDGDGRAEFATAGGARYAVFDFDCRTGGDPMRCNGMTRTDGVLWSQPSQDNSSNVTGSSVFDFDADGRAEAVYADECYLRIYEGRTGRVLYSAARSSGTAYENPIIADVDGDFRSEIVTSVNDYAGTLGCAATDPLLPASRFATGHGIVVLRDEMDRWAASRPIWNQHAYHVTHVGDRGEIQRSSLVPRNWRDARLNNFRQNSQGRLAALGSPDLTTTADPGPLVLMCVGDRGTLRARMCNRGTLPVPVGSVVSMRADSAMGMELCRASVASTIEPGACAEVTCEAMFPTRSIDVYIVADPDNAQMECLEGNNTSRIRAVQCGTPG